jgi:hypothetical protein
VIRASTAAVRGRGLFGLGSFLCVLLGSLSGCDGKPLLVGEPQQAVGGEGADSNPSAPRCSDAAQLRVGDPACWPTRHVGRWHGFVTGDARYLHVLPTPLEYPSQALALEIRDDGSAYATFAAPDAGVSADCAGPLVGGVCVQPGLVLGYRYALGALRMTGALDEDRRQDPILAFSLTIAQPWSDQCEAIAADAGPCACSEEGCGVSPQALQVTLRLSEDARALRGTGSSGSGPEALVADWELVRE